MVRYCVTVTLVSLFFFFFNDTATTEIYTLSLHDALPISQGRGLRRGGTGWPVGRQSDRQSRPGDGRDRRRAHRYHHGPPGDRKSTRLNSSHLVISYAVFCLKKKKKK